MIRITAVLAAVAISATAVYAQSADPIAVRQATMKQYGRAMQAPGRIMKGDAPFKLAAVQASLKTIEETSLKAKKLFPEESRIGETNALPAAFERKSDLFARFDKLAGDAKAARAVIKDEASFKAEWPKVGAHCVGCHREYTKLK